MRALLVAFATALFAAGCTVAIPNGTLRCTTREDCPAGWSCFGNVCFSEPQDAGPPDVGPPDAGRDGGRDAGRDAGPPDTGPPDAPIDAPPDGGPPTVVAVDCGNGHTCAVTSDARVLCWGTNENGEVGTGTGSTVDVTLPDEIEPLAGMGVTDVALGATHSCALAAGDRMWCWGSNAQGQLGDTTVSVSALPIDVTLPAPPVAIDAGGRFTCALLDDDRVFCWGENNNGEIATGAIGADVRTPTLVAMPAGRTATEISAGSDHACAVLDDESVACWGWNGFGQIGTGLVGGDVTSVRPVTGLAEPVRHAEAIGYHSCAVEADGDLLCWGRNNTWQLGLDEPVAPIPGPGDVATPTAVTLPEAATMVTGGGLFLFSGGHTCAAGAVLDLHCWGWNNHGQVGLGTTADTHAPAAVTMLPDVSALAGGAAHTCAISDGHLWCWGWNDDGQLGIASMAESRLPVRVMGLP